MLHVNVLQLLLLVFICRHCDSHAISFSDAYQYSACCTDTTVDVQRLLQWVEAGYSYIQQSACKDVNFTSHNECQNLQQRTRKDMTVYVGQGSMPGEKVTTLLPDGTLNRDGSSHDVVLVFDPYPTATFGHLVVVFFVDIGKTNAHCHMLGGTFLEDGAECVTLARKNKCYNLLDKNGASRIHLTRRCEINFLPLVHLDTVAANQENQLLRCHPIPGFAPCPELRPLNDTRHLICNPLSANTHRCHTSQETIHTKCRLFETCDHAVLVGGGGWNRDHSPPGMANNLRLIYHMLRRNGFHKSNIKIFYANGAKGNRLVGDNTHSVYPSGMKLALRYHLQKICQSPLCADSLVIYLNSPTQNDGSMLLWDVDGNGLADGSEVYLASELLQDLQDCAARQVYVLADQSFAGDLVKEFDQSTRHPNVVIFGSGQEEEYSWNREFSTYWANLKNHSSCVTDVHLRSHEVIQVSHPTMHDGSEDIIRTTIFGAPCDTRPAFTHKELQQKFLGCQNIPTKVWMNTYRTAT